jgi:hypothetical protein
MPLPENLRVMIDSRQNATRQSIAYMYVRKRTYRILGQTLTAIGALASHSRDYPHSEGPPNVSGAPLKIVKR